MDERAQIAGLNERIERERQDRLRAEVDAKNAVDRLNATTAELERAQQALQETEERFKAGADFALDAIVSADRRGMIRYMNKRAEVMFGYSAEEAQHQPFTILLPERHHDAHQRGFEHYVATGESHVIGAMVEWTGRRKDGSEFAAEISFSHWTARGRPTFAGIIRDVTERHGMADELRRSNAELAQFASVASHDLQEPLRMVASYMQLLSKRYADKLDEDAKAFIGYAMDGATRMQALVDDLLALSGIGARGKHLELTNCQEVFERVTGALRAAREESGAIVTHGDLPTVMADPSDLTQLFQNLIGNAIKFRSDRPVEVYVAAERTGGEWLFSVRDNGIGVDPQYAERIFEIFQRLHTRQEYPGTGIGLAICKKIVERQGGRIWVESDLGKGATFHFTLPAEEEKQT